MCVHARARACVRCISVNQRPAHPKNPSVITLHSHTTHPTTPPPPPSNMRAHTHPNTHTYTQHTPHGQYQSPAPIVATSTKSQAPSAQRLPRPNGRTLTEQLIYKSIRNKKIKIVYHQYSVTDRSTTPEIDSQHKNTKNTSKMITINDLCRFRHQLHRSVWRQRMIAMMIAMSPFDRCLL